MVDVQQFGFTCCSNNPALLSDPLGIKLCQGGSLCFTLDELLCVALLQCFVINTDTFWFVTENQNKRVIIYDMEFHITNVTKAPTDMPSMAPTLTRLSKHIICDSNDECSNSQNLECSVFDCSLVCTGYKFSCSFSLSLFVESNASTRGVLGGCLCLAKVNVSSQCCL